MSLFENSLFRWRETYFVLFQEKHRPSVEAITQALQVLAPRCQISEVRADKEGRFESLTLMAPNDFAAMDICYLAGEDVSAQVEELKADLKSISLTGTERAKLAQLSDFTARLEIYHFQQVFEAGDEDEDEEFLDPGALLQVMQRLIKLCHGVGVDPQSGALM